ncbi:hypothetical protein [Actinoallomurus sp. NPDC052274]|uniref:hypothetical protein n=1 Tax=Actinoallomurus sp. NPDC052274 TaxID=3155420 RepID=UPI0034428B7D
MRDEPDNMRSLGAGLVLASARGLLTGVVALLIAGTVGMAVIVVGLEQPYGFFEGPVRGSFGRMVFAAFLTPALAAVTGVQAAKLLRLPSPRAFAHLGWPVLLVTLWILLELMNDEPMETIGRVFLNAVVITFLLLPYPILACARTARARAALRPADDGER